MLGTCSGLELTTQLLALVVLISCLFRINWRQGVCLVATAVAAGFTVNAARIAFLGVIASRAPHRWEFWERPGPGSHLFPLAATALAGLGWWAVVRARSGPAPAARASSLTMRPYALRVERIEFAEAFSSLGTEWRGLAAAHGRGLPFATGEWFGSWWRHFRQEHGRVRDALFVRAFRAPAGELVGIAPLVLTRRSPLPGVALRSLDFFGTDPSAAPSAIRAGRRPSTRRWRGTSPSARASGTA